jgi:hypothetical protein
MAYLLFYQPLRVLRLWRGQLSPCLVLFHR